MNVIFTILFVCLLGCARTRARINIYSFSIFSTLFFISVLNMYFGSWTYTQCWLNDYYYYKFICFSSQFLRIISIWSYCFQILAEAEKKSVVTIFVPHNTTVPNFSYLFASPKILYITLIRLDAAFSHFFPRVRVSSHANHSHKHFHKNVAASKANGQRESDDQVRKQKKIK